MLKSKESTAFYESVMGTYNQYWTAWLRTLEAWMEYFKAMNSFWSAAALQTIDRLKEEDQAS